jgi:hypothetical protein
MAEPEIPTSPPLEFVVHPQFPPGPTETAGPASTPSPINDVTCELVCTEGLTGGEFLAKQPVDPSTSNIIDPDVDTTSRDSLWVLCGCDPS